MHNFLSINTKFQNFIKNSTLPKDLLFDNNYKLQLSDAIFCSEDIVRNRKFYEAIEKSLKDLGDNTIVVDAGSGTGILGLFALSLGAKKCIFIEHNPSSLKLSKEVMEYFGFIHKSEFLHGNATQITLKENFDLLISETIESSFGKEDFYKIVKNLINFGNSNSCIIPERFYLNFFDTEKNLLGKKEIFSKKDFKENSIPIKLGNIPKRITIGGEVCLYNDISIKSGESISFFNKREIDTKKNSFFYFYT